MLLKILYNVKESFETEVTHDIIILANFSIFMYYLPGAIHVYAHSPLLSVILWKPFCNLHFHLRYL